MGYDQQQRDRDELNRMRRKVDNLRGHGVTSSPYGASLPPPPKKNTQINFKEGWWGTIVQYGPENADPWGDDRYWVARARNANKNTDAPDAAAKFEGIPGTGAEGDDPYWQIVTASNVIEATSGGHVVVLGTPVWVTPTWDISVSPPRVKYVFSAGEPLMYQKIVSVSAISGTSNRKAYAWKQQRYLRHGQYEDVPGGADQSHATFGGTLYNTIESNNTTGLLGNGVDLAASPEGVMKGIGVGAVVIARRAPSCDDPSVPEWVFAGENAVVVACTG